MIWGLILAFIAGAVVSYLVLRNNPDIKGKVDDITDNIDNNIN